MECFLDLFLMSADLFSTFMWLLYRCYFRGNCFKKQGEFQFQFKFSVTGVYVWFLIVKSINWCLQVFEIFRLLVKQTRDDLVVYKFENNTNYSSASIIVNSYQVIMSWLLQQVTQHTHIHDCTKTLSYKNPQLKPKLHQSPLFTNSTTSTMFKLVSATKTIYNWFVH